MTVTEVQQETGWGKQGDTWVPPAPTRRHAHEEPDFPSPWDPGDVKWSARKTAAPGWAKCDGVLASRALQPRLFEAIGFDYSPVPGVDPGGGNFYLPNVKGRVMVGQDAADAAFDVLGETGGAKTVTLTATEMPLHSHTVNSHGHSFASVGTHGHSFASESPATGSDNQHHTHNFGTGGAAGNHGHNNIGAPVATNTSGHLHDTTAGQAAGRPTGSIFFTGTSIGPTDGQNADHTHSGTTGGINNNHQHTVNSHGHGFVADGGHGHGFVAESPGTNTQGSGAAHSNLQPYVVFNCFIKL